MSTISYNGQTYRPPTAEEMASTEYRLRVLRTKLRNWELRLERAHGYRGCKEVAAEAHRAITDLTARIAALA